MANDTDGKMATDLVTETAISVEVARATFSDLILRAGFGNERIQITRHGRPTAVLIGMKDLEKLQALDAKSQDAEPQAAA